MKEHLCPVEKALIAYEGSCNWCGQKEWIGLTDELIEQMGLSNYIKVVRETESKLKELNT